MNEADPHRSEKTGIGTGSVVIKSREACGRKAIWEMRKITSRTGMVVAVLTAICLLVLMGCGQGCNKSDNLSDSRIKVGALIALTGYGASFGQNEAKVVELLRDRYPNATFVVEDNKSDPRQAISAAKKLLDVDRVDIIYCDLTTVANAIVPMTKDAGVILVAAVYLTDLLDRNPLAIRNLPRGKDEAHLLLEHFSSTIVPGETPSVILLGSNDEFGRGSISDCLTVVKDFSLDVIGTETIPDDAPAIDSFAAVLASKKPSAIYMASLSPTLGTLIQKLRLAGYQGAILTTDAFAYSYIRDAAGEQAKGTIYVDFPETEESRDMSKTFYDRFNMDLNPTGVLLHDGISLILDTLYETNPQSLATLVDSLEGIEYAGTYGLITVRNRELLYPLVIKTAE